MAQSEPVKPKIGRPPHPAYVEREAIRLRKEGATLNAIALELRIGIGAVHRMVKHLTNESPLAPDTGGAGVTNPLEVGAKRCDDHLTRPSHDQSDGGCNNE